MTSLLARRRPPGAPADQASVLRALVGAPDRPAPRTPREPLVGARLAPLIAVASGKGGVGKTTIAVNLAAAAAQRGRGVTLVDGDLGLANADVLCGLCPARRLDEALGGGPHPALIDLAVPAPGGFRLVAGMTGATPDAAQRLRLFAAVEDLCLRPGLVFVDLGAGIARETLTLADGADLALIVVTPDPASITDAYAFVKCLVSRSVPGWRSRRPRPPGLGVLINQAPGARAAAEVHARLDGACRRFLSCGLPMLGWIPRDERIAESVRVRRPLLSRRARGPGARRLRAAAAAVVLAAESRIGSDRRSASGA